MHYVTLYLVYSKQKTRLRQLPTVGHSTSSSPLPFKKIRGIVNGKPIDAYVIDISTFSYKLSILHNTHKCMISTCSGRLIESVPTALPNYHWLHCQQTVLGNSHLHIMYVTVCTYVGLGRKAEDITFGRIRRERKSDSLTLTMMLCWQWCNVDNGHDSAGSWRLLTLHCFYGCYD